MKEHVREYVKDFVGDVDGRYEDLPKLDKALYIRADGKTSPVDTRINMNNSIGAAIWNAIFAAAKVDWDAFEFDHKKLKKCDQEYSFNEFIEKLNACKLSKQYKTYYAS